MYMRIAGKIHYCTVPYVSKRDKLRVMMIIYCSILTELKMTEWKTTMHISSSSQSSIAAPQ